ncbi:MAG: hypothetical protein LIP11_17935 [Clostridiales bacterium]|nr:hypothetical protein [Clostridiales bacterium]
MNWKETLEYTGYQLCLKYDEGIQYEFNLRKQQLHSNKYYKKVLLLIELFVKRRILGISLWDEWYRKQRSLTFPEWDNTDGEFDLYMGNLPVCEVRFLIVDIWNILVWPIFGNMEKQASFLDFIIATEAEPLERKKEGDRYRHAWKELSGFSIINEDIRSRILSALETGIKVILVDQSASDPSLVSEWLESDGFPEEMTVVTPGQLSSIVDGNGKKESIYLTLKKDRIKEKYALCIEIPDVLEKGKPYRTFPGNSPVECVYDTLMNIRFHWKTGNDTVDFFYGTGFKYGGILVAGICQWLNRIIKQYDIDSLLFTSRDCDIILQAYRKWFCHQDCEYIYVSRRALIEAMFETCPKMYKNGIFLPKISYEERVSVREIFQDMEIEFLLADLKDAGIEPDSPFDYPACEKISNIFEHRYQDIADHFRKYRVAAPEYLKRYFDGRGKVCVVDLGWKGTIARLLRQMKKEQEWNCEITGALVAAMDDEMISNEISHGDVVTYLFSNERTQNYKRKRGIPYNNQQVKCFETLLTSPEKTLNHYNLDSNGEVYLEFRDENPNADNIRQIHRGITDFLECFMPFIRRYNLKISSEEAFSPLSALLDNRKLVELFLEHLS